MEILRTVNQIARKEHRCDYCNLLIKSGELYQYSVCKADDFYIWKNHIDCQRIAHKLNMFNDVWNEGLTEDDFQEYIREEYNKLIKVTDGDDDESPPFKFQLNFIKNYYFNMKKEYFKVTLDLSAGSAYEYRQFSEIPTKIEYDRQFSGKFQEGIVEGNFSNVKMHDILFLIKRGCELSDIKERTEMVY